MAVEMDENFLPIRLGGAAMTKEKQFSAADVQEAKVLLSQLRKVRHVSSGYQTLDRLTGGFIHGGVTLIASRPAAGKAI